MSYYILPKNYNKSILSPQSCSYNPNQYISHSLNNYYKQLIEQINEMFICEYDISDNTFEHAIKMINPYEFIFSKVPGTKFSVSKLKPNTNIFYDLLEISKNLNIFEEINHIPKLTFSHISKNYSDSIECFEIFREDFEDKHFNNENVNFDIMFYECNYSNNNEYFIYLIKALLQILENQNYNGISIIKIGNVFHRLVVDVLYFLSSLYDKVYLCKPNTSNIVSFDKYIICKNFQYKKEHKNYLKKNYLILLIFLKKLEGNNIASLFENEMSNYFKCKIDDINIIIGQQQLEALEQIISIYKNKNKLNKIELIKKNNIQKSIHWCEKYQIPCNKFAEKTNIFLQFTE